MKNGLIALAVAALLVPAAALAQTMSPAPAPPAPPGPPGGHRMMRSEFRMMTADLSKAHKQARTDMLAALTPAHRALLASVVGQMAIAAYPDHKAAAAKLDAALSASEKQSILRIHKTLHDQMHKQMQEAHQKMMASLSADERKEMQAHMSPGGPPMMREGNENDPGRILLAVTTGHAGPMMMRVHNVEYHRMPGMKGMPSPAPAST
ncbi:MAG: hypothetical protein JOY59_02410 [Candidatus Eremiobacteraeota bacterium]|nr:hypothetical protein [Candidatus Eremiobacteraeota bacterium]